MQDSIYKIIFLFATLLCSFGLNTASAKELRLDFTATIKSSGAVYDDPFDEGIFSGYLIYDTDMSPSDVWPDGTLNYFGDSFIGYQSTAYIDQLDLSFETDQIVLSDGYNWIDFWGDRQVVEGGNYPEAGFNINMQNLTEDSIFFSDQNLPTRVNPMVLSGGETFGNSRIGNHDLFVGYEMQVEYQHLEISEVDYSGVIEVNADNELLLGGNRLSGLGILNETDATLVTSRTAVGYENRAKASFEQYGSSHLAGSLHIGGHYEIGGHHEHSEFGSGSYLLANGQLQTDVSIVGDNGVGVFKQLSGEHITGRLVLGNAGYESQTEGPIAKGVGSYFLEGGVLAASNVVVGNKGQGNFIQTGGSHIVGNEHSISSEVLLLIGGYETNLFFDDYIVPPQQKIKGSYELHSGDLEVYGETVIGGVSLYYPDGGTGSFLQTGGSFTTHGLTLGEGKTGGEGSGFYRMSGGILNVDGSVLVGEEDEDNRPSEFLQSGGIITIESEDWRKANFISIATSSGQVPNAYRIMGGLTKADSVAVGSENSYNASTERSAVLEVSGGGQLQAQTIEILQGGLLTGSGGSISGDVFVQEGVLDLGADVGTLEIGGVLYVGEGGQLQLNYESSSATDIINAGHVVLHGGASIEILLSSLPIEEIIFEEFINNSEVYYETGFDPETNIQFVFASGLGIQEGGVFNYSVDGQQYQFHYSAVPLPMSAWFMACGLFYLLMLRKKQN